MSNRPSEQDLYERIARALVEPFWGVTDNQELERVLDDIFIEVNDDGHGEPVRNVVKMIMDAISSK